MGWLKDTIVDFNQRWFEQQEDGSDDGSPKGKAELSADVSSLAQTAVNWIGESTQKVRINLQQGLIEPSIIETSQYEESHKALTKIIERPNPLYTGKLMRNLIARDRGVHGLSYVRMVRDNDSGLPERLWFLTYDSVEKETNGDGQLQYYRRYTPNGDEERIEIEDMLRFARGINKKDPYEGEGYFDYLPEVLYIDQEAIKFTAAVFQNAIAGVMVALDAGNNNSVRFTIGEKERKAFQDRLIRGFGSKKKGALLYTSAPYKTNRLEPVFSDLSIVEFHNFAEERTMSPTGVHPTTIGLGTGLQHTRITATASEYDRKSWEDGILPVAESITDTMTALLVPEYFDEEDEISVGYNVSHIRALRYTVDEVIKLVESGVINEQRGRALLQLG